MKSPLQHSKGAQVAVAVMVVLGLLGGCLIVAHSGFGTSPRRGGPSIFVPVPQAYVLAFTMFGMSMLGLLALLQGRRVSRTASALAVVLYAVVVTFLTTALAPSAL
ncbi:hypothetical protein DIC66_01050 [Rhodoferax lacus]|uniref:Uncharacterized protein n=1 Tax=Rhodoferax lacus TaxID=2184758 RepID=A0A3E1RGM1_9BURK|nr:hypothetical protein [Rhodoferax lacus]RFO98508.1 hypothetical protein DIC66_01050 [Rhodoferax lacus]